MSLCLESVLTYKKKHIDKDFSIITINNSIGCVSRRWEEVETSINGMTVELLTICDYTLNKNTANVLFKLLKII